MNILKLLREQFAEALSEIVDDPASYAKMVFPSQNPQFGDFQANCAMSLGKKLGKQPREIAAMIIERLSVDGFCDPPEIAGPGFINLKVKTDFLAQQLQNNLQDERLGIARDGRAPKTVIDFSSPNVAKPMHVGHLRSTVIGDALARILKFLGHDVVTDNHVGDWGTQFGMILYGYKHFLDESAYRQNPVGELSRLYRLVSQLCEYHSTLEQLPQLEQNVETAQQALNQAEAEANPEDKKQQKNLKKLRNTLAGAQEKLASARKKIEAVRNQPELHEIATAHSQIVTLTREETAKLHAGDEENNRLWNEFLPACNEAMEAVYKRLGIHFDLTLGESYYQPMLADVVEGLKNKGLASESQGAICVFVEGNEAPFIIQKKDGAFTYATTDLATIQYRVDELKAENILYVVDKRQSEHFQLLFDVSKMWGYDQARMQHVSFGTVMGKDNKPFKTRAGDTIGLESLLDESVTRARQIVDENDDKKPNGPELDSRERQRISEIIGLGGIKYADLHHNRESDYVFDWDKMLSMTGDTATYMQYAFARICGIFRKAGLSREEVRADETTPIQLQHDAERALGLQLLRFEEALTNVAQEYRPNLLTNYLFDTANAFSSFYEHCSVVKEEDAKIRLSRLKLCDLTARTIKLGLSLLGIETSDRM